MKLMGYIFILVLFPEQSWINAQPFSCSGDLILTVSSNTDSTRLYKIIAEDQPGSTILFEEISQRPVPYLNAIGYRSTDNYIYGIAPKFGDLYRLDRSGNSTLLHHFDWFDYTRNYNAGAITPDGKYLAVLSGNPSSPPLRSLEMILIDLESPDYTSTIMPLKTLSGDHIYSLDIAFDPYTGELYGFDGIKGRLITIQLFSALVDDLAFTAFGNINVMAAMFFDAFGNLYGYAQETGQVGTKALYRIDQSDGSVHFLANGPIATASDGCSCPYRIELLKSVDPGITLPCSEVEYIFKITNASTFPQYPIRFQDIFPPGFEALDISGNVFEGLISGLHSENLSIQNMMIPPGIDSFKVRVAVKDVMPGFYRNQASLSNLPTLLGSTERSDASYTLAFDDSTTLEVHPLDADFTDQYFTMCPGDTLTLDATVPGGIFSYAWENGDSMPVRNIDEVGTYKVNITNICESKEIAYKIEWASPELVIDLGPDHTIDLGEPFYLDPTLPDQANFTLHWSVKPDQMIHCYDCPQLDVIPLDNSTYTLTLIDEHECTYADSVHVMVQKAYHIYIPNSFSPNRDGLNDVLLVYGQPGTQVSYFRIYSRWGGLVFESTNSLVNEHSSGWNGQINGKMAPSDVYLWTSKIRFIDGEEKNYAGDVTVLR